MKNRCIVPGVDNLPFGEELLRRLSKDRWPIPVEPRWYSPNDLHDTIKKYDEICSKDFNNDMNYSFEYLNHLKKLEKQYHWMSSISNDSQWLQDINYRSERELGGLSSLNRKTKDNNWGKNVTEIDKMIIMLLQYRNNRNNNRGAHSYPVKDINKLLGDQNFKEQELIWLGQELLRVTQYEDMKSDWQQPDEWNILFDRSGFRCGRNVCKLNTEFWHSGYRKGIPWHKSKEISERKLEIPQIRKKVPVRNCRHFLKGHCDRGSRCGFIHDMSIFYSDRQKVFLGGIPQWFTSTILRQKLSELGYTTLNNPKIFPGFSPEVCLGSDDEAQKLIERGSIVFDGVLVSVRPFEHKNPNDEVRRSVFLGGLAVGTTAAMIKEALAKLDVTVVNHPTIRSGYSPRVMLLSYEEKQYLVQLGKVSIHGVVVNIRPYAKLI